MTRKKLLEALLGLEMPVENLLSDLDAFGWDSEEELSELNRHHVISILRRFQTGRISDENIEEWANAVEGRDDIGFEPGYEDMLTDAIYELANPELTQSLTAEAAEGWIRFLSEDVLTATGT